MTARRTKLGREVFRVERISQQTPEILAFELAHPWGRALPSYEAGAHIDVHMPGGFSRQYSLAHAPNPARSQITGLICGYRVEEIEEPLQREIRYLDKLIDELANGKAMEKIMREPGRLGQHARARA